MILVHPPLGQASWPTPWESCWAAPWWTLWAELRAWWASWCRWAAEKDLSLGSKDPFLLSKNVELSRFVHVCSNISNIFMGSMDCLNFFYCLFYVVALEACCGIASPFLVPPSLRRGSELPHDQNQQPELFMMSQLFSSYPAIIVVVGNFSWLDGDVFHAVTASEIHGVLKVMPWAEHHRQFDHFCGQHERLPGLNRPLGGWQSFPVTNHWALAIIYHYNNHSWPLSITRH